MTAPTVVFGYGTVGRLVAAALLERGGTVRIAQRSRPAVLPAGATFMPCDILDPAAVRHAVQGTTQAVLSVSFPYDARVWRTAWPATMTNIVQACARTSTRVVFIDNLYQLGPQTEPRREDMPLSQAGQKPAILSDVSRIWMAARDRMRLASLRCSDFYGPDVPVSHLGASGFGRVARGQPALLLAPPDTAHDFAYVPDIARATVTLLDAPDDAFGQAWNMPCAPTRTPRQILKLGADAIGQPLRVRAVPLPLLRPLGLVSRFAREVADVGFTWDRPYRVDATRFTRRFAFAATPFEIGAPATVRSFINHAR